MTPGLPVLITIKQSFNVLLLTSLKWFENVNGARTANFGEVQFFFRANIGNNQMKGLALVSVYGQPDPDLLRDSSQALWVSIYHGDEALKVIDIKSISTCVAMIPFTKLPDGRFFVCEKMGLEVAYLADTQEDAEDPGDPDDIYV